MNLIAESLLNFYSTIENKKEYEKIKQELMGDLVPIKVELKENPIAEKTCLEVAIDQNAIDTQETPVEIKLEENEHQIGVIIDRNHPIRKFTILFPRARFGEFQHLR